MTLTEKSAYLKGLADGMKLDTEKNEGKLLSEIIDFLSMVSEKIELIDDEQGFIADKLGRKNTVVGFSVVCISGYILFFCIFCGIPHNTFDICVFIITHLR